MWAALLRVYDDRSGAKRRELPLWDRTVVFTLKRITPPKSSVHADQQQNDGLRVTPQCLPRLDHPVGTHHRAAAGAATCAKRGAGGLLPDKRRDVVC
jgi:hypothetical protein